MDWKGCGRRRQWPNMRYHPGIFLGQSGEAHKKSVRNRTRRGECEKRRARASLPMFPAWLKARTAVLLSADMQAVFSFS